MAVLDHGRLIGIGTPTALKDRHGPGAVVVAKMPDPASIASSSASSGVPVSPMRSAQFSQFPPSNSPHAPATASSPVAAAPTPQQLVEFLRAELPEGRLLDERLGQVKYAVPQDTEWCRLFAVMERAARRFRLEDYTVNACSLEDVFLQLSANSQRPA